VTFTLNENGASLQIDLSIGALHLSAAFQAEVFLLGYGVEYLLANFLLQPDLHPGQELLLELCEESLERLEICLQAELDTMACSSSDDVSD